jgi:hypothetical protein
LVALLVEILDLVERQVLPNLGDFSRGARRAGGA